MHAAGQTRVKAAHRSHDVDAFALVRAILFKDRRVLHRILVRARCTIDISHAPIPGRVGIGTLVVDLSVLDNHVMGKYSAHRLVESTAYGFLWHCELVPRFGVAGTYLSKCLIDTVQCDGG